MTKCIGAMLSLSFMINHVSDIQISQMCARIAQNLKLRCCKLSELITLQNFVNGQCVEQFCITTLAKVD